MQTKLYKIKEIALSFLHLEPEINKDFSLLVNHPFIDTNPMIFSFTSGIKHYNIKDKKELNEVIHILEGYINDAKDVYELFGMIRNADKRTFFYYIKDYLSEKEYGELLSYAWITTEFPHFDKNISVAKFKSLFQNANKKYLMNEKEFEVYSSLPNKITIYRGIQGNEYYKALSWTLDKDKARWFSKRFSNNGTVFKAEIEKKYVSAYFEAEDEIIVDYNKLENITNI